MNIAFFTDTYFPQMNGVVISIDHYAKQLRKMGHTVYIFAPVIDRFKDDDPFVIRLTAITVLKTKPAILFPFLVPNTNYKKMFSLPIDIIHAHGNGAFSLLGYQVARFRHIPFTLTFHTMWTQYMHYVKGIVTPRMAEQAMRLFGNICDAALTPSAKMKLEMVRYGVTRPVYVIPNFIQFAKFDHVKRGFLRSTYKISDSTDILLSVGRLGREKNFDFIVDMFHKLVNTRPNLHLVLVGYGPEEQRLRQKLKTFRITDKVTITGLINRDDVPRIYADSDIFVFASTSETQGIIVLEAAASGLPVVIVKDPAYAGMVENEKSGYELPLSDTQFIEKITYLLDHPEKRKDMGQYGKQLVRKEFDEEVLANRLLTVYKKMQMDFSLKPSMLQRLGKPALDKLIQTATVARDFFK